MNRNSFWVTSYKITIGLLLRRTLVHLVRFSAMGAVLLLLQTTLFAQKKNSNRQAYPYGNPVITHMYTADASPHVMPDGRMWMVTSVDSEEGGGYATMHSYHTFSSADMKTWTDHGEIFNISDVEPKNVQNEDWALWAPDIIYRNGKYYLYYPVRILHTDDTDANGGRKVTSYIGVAVSDAPDKKFTVLRNKIEGTSGIDPAVFADDDGSVYLLWGHAKIAKLKPNMMELEGKTVSLDLGTDRFMEAIWLHKRNGTYYVSYHTKYGNKIDKNNPDDPTREKSEIAYSYSNNIMGPYFYGGVVNYELGVGVEDGPKYPGRSYVPWRLTQSNHVGITGYHGQDYLFYHTSALSSWRQDSFKDMGTWTQRSVCIDKLNYDANGHIVPVKQTLKGVEPVLIRQPFEIGLLQKPVTLSNGKTLSFSNVDLGSGYYYFGVTVSGVQQPFTIQIKTSDGKLLGTVPVWINGTTEVGLNAAHGKQSIQFNINGNADGVVLQQARFFAGSPKQLKK